MRLRKLVFIPWFFSLLLTVTGITGFGQAVLKQGKPVPSGFCINDTVIKLYRIINHHRQDHGLPPIPLSKSLCYVAALHAKDLFLHHPDKGGCNSYSWSDKSALWKPFCYPRDENKKISVWDKPRELTKYPAKAYELVYWENNPLVTDTIIMVWKTEDFCNSFFMNSGKWQGKVWNAIGIAVFENYVCAWFGEVADPEGIATVCGAVPEIQKPDTLKPVVKPVEKPAVKPCVRPKKGNINKVNANKPDSLGPKPADTLASTPVNRPAIKPAKTTIAKDTTQLQHRDSVPVTWYIIIKTNLTRERARQLADTLKNGEYPDAKVLDKDGKLRVSVYESRDKAVIMAKLKEVKKSYKDAWLLKK